MIYKYRNIHVFDWIIIVYIYVYNRLYTYMYIYITWITLNNYHYICMISYWYCFPTFFPSFLAGFEQSYKSCSSWHAWPRGHHFWLGRLQWFSTSVWTRLPEASNTPTLNIILMVVCPSQSNLIFPLCPEYCCFIPPFFHYSWFEILIFWHMFMGKSNWCLLNSI